MTLYLIEAQALAATIEARVDYQQRTVDSPVAGHATGLLLACDIDGALPEAWYATEANVPRLDLHFRNLQLTMQGQRASVIGPPDLHAVGVAAVAGCYTLLKSMDALAESHHRLEVLLTQALATPEDHQDITALQHALQQAHAAGLRQLALHRHLEWPNAYSAADLTLRLRTELCVQAQMLERLHRLDDELEWLRDGLIEIVDRKQESARARSEGRIGLVIIALLVVDLIHGFWHG